MSIAPVYISSTYNAFLYFLERQVHKDSKIRIMPNIGKNSLVKVTFTNIHKISDACAKSFCRYIMIAQCMRNILLFIKFTFLWKNGVSEKIKGYLLQHTPALQQLFIPYLFNFIQKTVSPIHI